MEQEDVLWRKEDDTESENKESDTVVKKSQGVVEKGCGVKKYVDRVKEKDIMKKIISKEKG